MARRAGLSEYLGGKGRYGDTMVAHINPEEAALLKARGGAGTRNPRTGLLEFYYGSWGADSSGAATFSSDGMVGSTDADYSDMGDGWDDWAAGGNDSASRNAAYEAEQKAAAEENAAVSPPDRSQDKGGALSNFFNPPPGKHTINPLSPLSLPQNIANARRAAEMRGKSPSFTSSIPAIAGLGISAAVGLPAMGLGLAGGFANFLGFHYPYDPDRDKNIVFDSRTGMVTWEGKAGTSGRGGYQSGWLNAENMFKDMPPETEVKDAGTDLWTTAEAVANYAGIKQETIADPSFEYPDPAEYLDDGSGLLTPYGHQPSKYGTPDNPVTNYEALDQLINKTGNAYNQLPDNLGYNELQIAADNAARQLGTDIDAANAVAATPDQTPDWGGPGYITPYPEPLPYSVAPLAPLPSPPPWYDPKPGVSPQGAATNNIFPLTISTNEFGRSDPDYGRYAGEPDAGFPRPEINLDRTPDDPYFAPPPWNQSGVFTGTSLTGTKGFPNISQKTIDAASFNAANAPSVYDAGYGVGDQRSGYISPYPAPSPVSAASLAPPQAGVSLLGAGALLPSTQNVVPRSNQPPAGVRNTAPAAPAVAEDRRVTDWKPVRHTKIEPGSGKNTGLYDLIQFKESGNDPNARNAKSGAFGLMQLMPKTAKDPGFGVTALRDNTPEENRRFGEDYFEAMMNRYGQDMSAALVAYNWGPGNADAWMKYGGNPAELPKETRDFVISIMTDYGGEPFSDAPAKKDKVSGVNPTFKRGGIVGDDGIGYGSDSIERLIAMATDPMFNEAIPATAGALMQGVPQPGGPAPTMAFRNNPSYVDGGVVAPGGPPQAGVSPQGAGAGPLPMQQMEVEMQRMMQEHPQEIAKMQLVIQRGLQSGELTREELNMAVQLATAAAQNPQLWPQLRQFAIQQGLADEQDLPSQYDQGLVFAILLASKAVQSGAGAQGVPQSQGQPPQAVMRTGGEMPASNNADGSIAINAHEGEGILHQGVMKAKGKDFLDKLNSTYEQDGSRKERSSASANV